jgi:hypothetical protein
MNFERIAVGEPLAGAREAQLRNQTLMLLEWGNSGYTLYVALPNMTEQEAEIIKHNKVKVRMLGEADCLLPVWQFIDSQLFGETPFDPTLYLPYYLDCKEDLPKTNLVTIIGVDSATMIIKALRAANLPNNWRHIVSNAWSDAWEDPTYSKRYNAWIDTVIAQYTPKQLLREALRIGYLGESMDK